MNEQHVALLQLLKPGIWYCATEFEGCVVLELGTSARGMMFSKLVRDGYVESEPVFEGFTTMKYRITDAGSDWLAAQ